jgi:hypothetical protein
MFECVPIHLRFRMISSGWLGCEWVDLGELAHRAGVNLGHCINKYPKAFGGVAAPDIESIALI